ncbi:MAG: hypothetical protein KC996_09085 [Phycisphaerales bacterium]|nr:hypothetical protein [Phycisphaerales bacterium]
MKLSSILLVGTACAATTVAQADLFVWDWAAGDSGVSNAGGTFDSIHTTYDSSSSILTWEMTFSDQITDGFTLAINGGPNPQGYAGEFALLYFDATDLGDLRLTAFAYNGENTQTSYMDGSEAPGTQAPDEIYNNISILNELLSASVTDAAGARTFAFSIDTSVMNAHSPLYPAASAWTGMQFGSFIGAWVHPVTGLTTAYDGNGSLTNWAFAHDGFMDTSWRPTTPAPGSLALLAFGGTVATRRRR